MCRAIWPSSNGASIAAPVSPTCSISFLPQPSRPRRDPTPPLLRRTQLGNQAPVRTANYPAGLPRTPMFTASCGNDIAFALAAGAIGIPTGHCGPSLIAPFGGLRPGGQKYRLTGTRRGGRMALCEGSDASQYLGLGEK